MTHDLTLYTNPMSRGRIARWMLEEIGQPYEATVLGYGESMQSPEYLAVNPMGKVPAVRHGDTVVTECAAICAYLADAFPQAGLAPASGSRERAPFYRWLFFVAGPLEQAATNKALGLAVPQDKQGMVGYGSLERVLGVLESELSARDFIAGPAFTAADVYVGAHVGWGMQFGTIDRRPAFERYYARLADRPALKRAAEIDDALAAEYAPPSG